MNLSVGIVGLPNSGKSTLFNALLKRQIAQVAEYPFTTIEPNTGVVEVPDERLVKLAKILRDKDIKILSKNAPNISVSRYPSFPLVVPSAIKFIDIAGLVKGAHQGEGLGNKFLGHIREVEVILHIVRVFENEKVTHVMGEINPERDMTVVQAELEAAQIKKPTLDVFNVSEDQLAHKICLGKICVNPIVISARLEAELGELSPEEQKEYLKELGVEESGLDKVIKENYKLLDLITFFTIKGGKQIQAWPLKRGKTAFEAAALVHTDMARGFIKAEVVSFEDLVAAGSWQKAHEAGKVRLEGKDDQVCDGDVIEFKFQA